MPTANKMIEQGVGIVVALLVGGLMAALLLPVAISEINSADTSSWSGGTVALWDILPLILVLGFFLTVVGWAVSVYKGS